MPSPTAEGGSAPEGPAGRLPKLCDASGMAQIHRYYRAGFGEGPDLVSGVREGDTRHAAIVARHLEVLSLALHNHHEGEDQRLWSTLTQRAPACALHVERMKSQHQAMLAPLRDLDAALPTWRTSAGRGDAQPVLSALADINEALAVHLGDEEQTIVPVMENVLTEPEVRWFSEHGRKATPKGELWNVLGAVLAAQPDGGTEFSRKNLPAPVRLLWRVVGRRRYDAHRAALLGQT